MLATTISPSVVVSVFSFVVSFVDSFGLWNNNKYKLEIYYYSPREVMLILTLTDTFTGQRSHNSDNTFEVGIIFFA